MAKTPPSSQKSLTSVLPDFAKLIGKDWGQVRTTRAPTEIPELQTQISKIYFRTLLPVSGIAMAASVWGLEHKFSLSAYTVVALNFSFSLLHYIWSPRHEFALRVGFAIFLIVVIFFIAFFGEAVGMRANSRQLSITLTLGPLTVFSWGLMFTDKPRIGMVLGLLLSFALTFLVFVWSYQGIKATDFFFPLMLLACLTGIYYTSKISQLNQRFLHDSRELRRDSLTGLDNRRALNESYSKGNPIAGGYLAVLDIDHFKNINDQHGHSTGDKILRSVTQVMQSSLSAHAKIYRWGGEEFVAIVSGLTRRETDELLNRVRQEIEQQDFLPERKVTLSIGLSRWYPEEPLSEVFDRADEALFKAKKEGRNCVVWG